MNPTAFFNHVRSKLFGGALTQGQVDGINALLDATLAEPLTHRAYLLATAFHETARTMQPIREYGRGRGRKYGEPGPHGGQVGYGRGYVQLTWPENYARADKELDLGGALTADYDRALEPKLAAAILVRGCTEGWFTGKSLSDYLPGDYVNARRVVNGTDAAHQIARYAETFEEALRLAEKPAEAPVVADVAEAPEPTVVAPESAPEAVAPVPAPSTTQPTDEKPWYASVGVWGGILATFGGASILGGAALSPDEITTLAEGLANFVPAAIALAGGLAGVIGRIRARKTIR